MVYCYYCGCEVLESEPKFTFHFYINEPNVIPLSKILNISFPFSFLEIAHDIEDDGWGYVNKPYIISLCSRNCFFLMEEYRIKKRECDYIKI